MPDRCKLETEKSQLNKLPSKDDVENTFSLPADLQNPPSVCTTNAGRSQPTGGSWEIHGNGEQLPQRMEQAEREQIGSNWAQD